MIFNIIIGWIHVMLAIAIIGGGFFNAFILAPKLETLDMKVAGELRMAVGKGMTHLVWGSLAGLFITGIIRAFLDKGMKITFGFSTDYGVTMNIKLLVFMIIVLNAYLITKASNAIPNTDPKDRGALSSRIMKLSISNIVLGTFIVLLAQGLHYGGTWL